MFSFTTKKQQNDVKTMLARICDHTTPNMAAPSEHDRTENRFNRSIPTLLCPWENGEPCPDDNVFVLTKDVSDIGIGIIAHQPIRVANVVVGLWPNDEIAAEPWFFTGEVKRNAPMGGGFWIMGIELTDCLNLDFSDALQSLRRLAKRLRVPATVAV